MKKLLLVAGAVVSAVVVYLVASPSGGPSGTAAAKAAPLSAPGLDGKTISLADHAGKVVLVDFWATWCDPCREEIPDLARLRAKLAARGFEVLGVSMDEEGADAVKAFAAKTPIPYPVMLNGGERAPAGWTVPGLPTAYLVGRDGRVRKRWFGSKDAAELEAEVEAALAR